MPDPFGLGTRETGILRIEVAIPMVMKQERQCRSYSKNAMDLTSAEEKLLHESL